VTGVSGSGKSTLIQETLYPLLMHHIYGSHAVWGQHETLNGLEHLDKVIDIDQSPIGRTPRSNPATYTGTFTPIREFRRGGQVCREFSETSWRGNRDFTRTGVACRDIGNGHWRFDG